MQKLALPERPDWREKAKELGFSFADMHGEPYWEESSAYQFSLHQIENDLEEPTTVLHAMCREAVAAIVQSQELMERLAIPREHWDLIADSWNRREPEIYGRMDLAYDGNGPAKLLEYNADTPTSLYESASFQWSWLEDQIAAGVLREGDDQFNGIHEALVERFKDLFQAGEELHFTAVGGDAEDYATVECMGWAAREAGLGAHYFDIDKLGVSTEGQFIDDKDQVIGTLFKLYPWENLLREPFSAHLQGSGAMFLEPAWKALVSNKGILPVLWQMFEGHPNLLPAFFEDDIAAALAGGGAPRPEVAAAFERAQAGLKAFHVRKPLFSREGASVDILRDGAIVESAQGRDYDQFPRIIQAYHKLPQFDGFRPVIGAWVVGHHCAGIGIREDRSRITQNLSRFKPHFIRD